MDNQLTSLADPAPDEVAELTVNRSWTPSGRLKYFESGVQVYLVSMLVVNLLLVFSATLLRYVFGVGIPWSQDVSRLLLASLVFPGSALAMFRGEHRSLRLLLDVLPKRLSDLADSFSITLIAGFSVVLFRGALEWKSGMAGTLLGSSIPSSVMTYPLLLGSLLLAVYCGALLLDRGWRQLAAGLVGGGIFVGLVLLAAQIYPGLASLNAAFGFWCIVLLVLLLLGMPIGFAFGIVTFAIAYGTQGAIPFSGITRRLTTSASEFVLTAVPFFIAAGLLMEAGDMTNRIIRLARSFVGHIRGGMGHVMIGSMYFMSGVTGSEAADVAAVGTVMRKPMKQAGFSGGETAGILVAASVMGASVPPSIGLIVIAASTTLSVGTLFMAGFLPAVVLACALLIAVYIRARILGLEGEQRAGLREVLSSLKAAAFAIGLPVIIIGGLTLGFGTPTELSTVAVFYVLIVEMTVHGRLEWRKLVAVCVDTAVMTGMLLFIVATASSLVYVSTFALIPQRIGTFLADAAGSNATLFLFLTILALIPLGMLTEGLPALLIFPPLFLPTATLLGIDSIHYAILMFIAVYIGANMPPLGAGYYFAASVVRVPVKDGMIPALGYLGIVTIGLCVLALVPQVTLLLPRLMGVGG